MKRIVALVFLLCVGSTVLWGAKEQQRGMIRIPTQEDASRLSHDERRELEILFATTVEKALQHGWAIPGQYVNLDDPNIRFVYEYNLWLEKRRALIKSFGIDVFQNAIDIKEIMQFERAAKSWKAYCKDVDENYNQFKQTKRSFKKLERKLNSERDGVYR